MDSKVIKYGHGFNFHEWQNNLYWGSWKCTGCTTWAHQFQCKLWNWYSISWKNILTPQKRNVDPFPNGQSSTPAHINQSFLEIGCLLRHYKRQCLNNNLKKEADQTVAKGLAMFLFQLGHILCFQQPFSFFIPQTLSEVFCVLRALFSRADHKYYALAMAIRFHESRHHSQPTYTMQGLQNHPAEIYPAKKKGEFVLIFLWTSKVVSPLSDY